jgi:hypothetical protein
LHTLGPGISQRAAAARTQTVWRWLVSVVTNRTYTIWLSPAGARSPVIFLKKK